MAPPRRKGPVGQFVATMGAPTEREVEMYVVDMEADQLARLKVAPTMPEKEVSVGVMEQIALPKRAAMMDAATIPEKEGSVYGMERIQAQSVNLAAKKGVPALPRQEVSVGDMDQNALKKRAVMKDAAPMPEKKDSVGDRCL